MLHPTGEMPWTKFLRWLLKINSLRGKQPEETEKIQVKRASPQRFLWEGFCQPSTQAFSSRSHNLARNFVTSPHGIPQHFTPSWVEWAEGECLGTKLEFCCTNQPLIYRPDLRFKKYLTQVQEVLNCKINNMVYFSKTAYKPTKIWHQLK